ncbi:MAG: NUDIX domain-containing protein [Dactylosporangium sp.]|nr:NUDIX domain-containing protein [Dactylosporangium sp.]NNJ60707.1 NUDIX domain-containing protein [Dactylosporangium sp.]
MTTMRQHTSAGAVVTTDVDHPRVLLLDQVRVTGQRQTVAPKGRLEPGESPLAAALREVTEEAGLCDLAYAGYLGQDHYAFTDNDGQPAAKTVDWFLLTTDDPTTSILAGEGFTAARWVDLDQAADVATHPGFAVYLDRASDLLAWRRSTPVPHSRFLDRLVRQAASEASAILADQPGAGVAVCGSGARGDFVNGWSDLDLIGYGLPSEPPTADTRTAALAEALTTMATDLSRQSGVKVSIRCADRHGRDLTCGDSLRSRKLQVALSRIGVDVAVIAGATSPDLHEPDPREPASDSGDRVRVQRDDLIALRDFATAKLTEPAEGDATQRDRIRRTLSAAGSTARIVAANLDPRTPLRLPTVASLLRTRWAGNPMSPVLDGYDAFRRDGARDLQQIAALAERVPDAIDALIALTSSGASSSHATPAG